MFASKRGEKAKVPSDGTISTDELSALYTVRTHSYWQFAAAIGVTLILLGLAQSILFNKNLDLPLALSYLFNDRVLNGVVMTLVLTILCQALAMAIGVVIALMKLANNRYLRATADLYLWFFRGVPLLVQLIFWYNLAALFPVIFLGVPFTSLGVAYDTNALISGFTAAVLAFSLHEGAYMGEIFRAGLLSVSTGQREAAQSAGMTEAQAFWKIILPQAMRIIIPPTGNQTIGLLKGTSLVAFISGGDLLSNVQDIYAVNFAVIPLLVTATIWYLALVSAGTIGQYFLEKRFGRGVRLAS